jgi:hypothetical protein
MKIILPKTLHDGESAPLFFLLGPIKGGGGWQERCCIELDKRLRHPFYVAVPCRWTAEHPLYSHRIGGDENRFQRQTPWERYYLANAARSGCIIAWLPCEDKNNPRADGQPYARDTYGEIGEWRGRLMHGRSLRFVIGAEEKFPGLDVMSRNFEWALGDSFKIHSTLEETITAAISKSGAH